jgi:hypothetical protein
VHLPALVDGEWHSIKQQWTCTPAELSALFDTIPLHASALVWQYLAAVRQVSPPSGPQRQTARNLVKHIAARETQRLYPLIKALYTQEVWWTPRFRRMVELVTEHVAPHPSALELTAWLIEHQLGLIWKGLERNGKKWTLKRPTEYDVAGFRKEYLYHLPRWKRPPPHTPREFEDAAHEVEGVLKKVPGL